jgi:hypothetical protein
MNKVTTLSLTSVAQFFSQSLFVGDHQCGEVHLEIKWTQNLGKKLLVSKYMHLLIYRLEFSTWGICFYGIFFSKQTIFNMYPKQA